MSIVDLTKGVKEVGNAADKLTTTDEERQAELTSRHKTDMLSDSWLSKNVRPIAFLFALFCQLVIVLASIWLGLEEKSLDPWITGQVGTLLITTTGFYFSSRRAEKIAANNTASNLAMKKMELKQEAKKERRERRLERIKARKNGT